MKKVSKEEMAKIVERHGMWIRGEEGGEWADLSGVDLRWAAQKAEEWHEEAMAKTNLQFEDCSKDLRRA